MTAPFAVDNDYEAWKKKRQQEDADYQAWLSKRTAPSTPGQKFDAAPSSAPESPAPSGDTFSGHGAGGSFEPAPTPLATSVNAKTGQRYAGGPQPNSAAELGLREGVSRTGQSVSSGMRTVAELLGDERTSRALTSSENWFKAGGDDAAAADVNPNTLGGEGTRGFFKTAAETAPFLAGGAIPGIALGAVEGVGNVRDDLERQGIDQDTRDKAALGIGATTGALWALVPGQVGSRLRNAFADEATALTSGAVRQLTLLGTARAVAKASAITGAEMAAAGGTAAGVEYAGESAVPGTKPLELDELGNRIVAGAESGFKTGAVLGAGAGAVEAGLGRANMEAQQARAQQLAATGIVPEAPSRPPEPPAPAGPPADVPVAVERPPAPPQPEGPPPGVPVAVERPPAGTEGSTAPAGVGIEPQGSAVAPPAPPPEVRPESAPSAPAPENKTEPTPESVTDENRRLKRELYTDQKTGLQNGRAHAAHVERLEREGTVGEHDFVALDMAGLKVRNDAQSHAAGDAEITRAGQALAQAADEVGVESRDVYHISGDEFSAIVPKGKGEEILARAKELYGERPIEGTPHANRLDGVVGESWQHADEALGKFKLSRPKELQSRPIEPGSAEAVAHASPEVRSMAPSEIAVDPERFQFKGNVDEKTGAGQELKGVEKWNPDLAGVVSVWKDPADGKTYVINGHHRVELANRLGVDKINVRYIDAPDAKTARATGAFINLAEGRGTPTDIAKFMRDHGATVDDLKAEGVSVRGDLAKKGVGLSRLAPDLFDKVATGKLDEGHAAAIGNMIEDHGRQREAAKIVAGKRLSTAEVTEVARQVEAAGSESTSQETLFGTETVDVGLYVDRARVAAAVKKRLAGDRRLFGFISKDGRAEDLARAGNTSIDVDAAKEIAGQSATAEELFDRLSTRSGPIGDALTEAARRVARGEELRTVVGEHYEAIRSGIEAERLAGAPSHPGNAEAGRPGTAAAEEGEAGSEVRPAPGGVDEHGNVRDSIDENQAGMFGSPQDHNRFHDPDLFGGFDNVDAKGQGDMFAPDEVRAAPADRQGGPVEIPGKITPEEIAAGKNVSSDELSGYQGPDNGRDRSGRPVEQTRLLSPDATGHDAGAADNPVNEASDFGANVRKITGEPRQRPDMEVRSLRKIAKGLADGLNLSLEEGRLGKLSKVANGWFHTYFEHARTRRFDTGKMRTAAHEAGHFVSKRWLGWPTRKELTATPKIPLSKEAVAELDAMGRALYGSTKPGAGYPEEGIAEWFAHYTTQPHVLEHLAPEFTKVMDKVFAQEPSLATPWRQAQLELKRFMESSPQSKVEAMISRKPDRWHPKWSGFLRATEEQYVGIRSLVRQAVEVRGEALRPSENPLKRFILAQDVAERVADILKHGATKFDGDGKRTTPSLLSAMFQIHPDDMPEFDRYLAAKDAIERKQNGIDNGIDLVAAAKTVAELEEKYYRPAETFWANAHAQIDYRVGVLLTSKDAARIKRDHQFYASNERDMEGDKGNSGRGTGGGNSKGVHSQTSGSTRSILPATETAVTGWARTIRQVHFAKALQTLVEMATPESPSHVEGIGRFIQEVPAPQIRTDMSLGELRGQLRMIGESLPDYLTDGKAAFAYINQLIKDNVPGQPAPELALEQLAIYRDKTVAGGTEAKDRVFPVLLNGKRRWFQVTDRGILDDIAQLSGKEMDALQKWVGAPARVIREGATSTPGFALWNMGKDAMRQTLFSRADFALPGWRLLQGVSHWLKEDAVYQKFIQDGGGGAGLMPQDRAELQAHMTRLTAERSWLTRGSYVVRHPMDALRLLGEMGETGARVGQAEALYQKLKKQGLSERDARVEAAYEGRQVGQDFSKMGWLSKALNRYIPFLAPRIGGTFQDLRLLAQPTRPEEMVPGEQKYDRMQRAYLRGASVITTLAVGSYLMQRDDPEWKKLPSWAKMVAMPIIMRGHDQGPGWDGYGSGKVEATVYIPLPQGLVGVLFGLLPRALAETVHSQKPDALKDVAGQFFQEINPLGTRDLSPGAIASSFAPLTGATQDFANRDFYFNRPIVPKHLQGAEPRDQTTPGTSETFRRIGDATGLSPARMEHFVNSQTGGIARPFTAGLDVVVRAGEKLVGAKELRPPSERPDGPLAAQIPGVSRYVRGPEGTNSEVVQKFYDRADQASRAYESWQLRVKAGNTLGARAFLEAHKADIKLMATNEQGGGVIRKSMAAIAKMRSDLRRIPDGPGAQDKRHVIEERINELAQRALDHADQ